jgi:hypothetical protein
VDAAKLNAVLRVLLGFDRIAFMAVTTCFRVARGRPRLGAGACIPLSSMWLEFGLLVFVGKSFCGDPRAVEPITLLKQCNGLKGLRPKPRVRHDFASTVCTAKWWGYPLGAAYDSYAQSHPRSGL